MNTEELLSKVKEFDKQIRNAQSDKDRLLGEQSQLETQKQEIVDEIRSNFSCSVKELVEKLSNMKKDLEQRILEIERDLNNE